MHQVEVWSEPRRDPVPSGVPTGLLSLSLARTTMRGQPSLSSSSIARASCICDGGSVCVHACVQCVRFQWPKCSPGQMTGPRVRNHPSPARRTLNALSPLSGRLRLHGRSEDRRARLVGYAFTIRKESVDVCPGARTREIRTSTTRAGLPS